MVAAGGLVSAPPRLERGWGAGARPVGGRGAASWRVGGLGGTGRRGKEIGSGSGGKTDSVRSRGERFTSLRAADSPVRQCEWQVHRFAGRHGGGHRHGRPSRGSLVPVGRRCFRGCPPCIRTDRDIYIYIDGYIHTRLLGGRWCAALVARYIFLQTRWVPIPRRQ